MIRRASVLMWLILAMVPIGGSLLAQGTGTLNGTITDQSGAVIPNAAVTITNKNTGIARSETSSSAGTFSAPAMPAGDYTVKVTANGFKNLETSATVLVGEAAQANLAMQVGGASETVTVEATAAQLNYENHSVQGVIEHEAIQEIPLNGRSYIQLASLEPGVSIVNGSTAQFNALFYITVFGLANHTQVAIDGGIVSDNIDSASGGSSLNISQEVVQEFQMSTANFDITTPVTAGGFVNAVTRSGTNDLHGSAYFFYRDRNTAAFPLLARTPGQTGNPFFNRKQPGAAIGGPIAKDKTFFFFAYEHTSQVQALQTVATDPAVAPLSAPAGSPYTANLYSFRLDHHLSTNHNLFVRYSHDGNNGFGPSLITEDPSGWANNTNWADQSIIGLTSTLTPALVNDARFNFNYWSNKNFPTAPGQCQLPCVGGVLPTLYSVGGFAVGNNLNAPQARQTRRFEESDNVSWQKGSHRVRFGGDANRAISAGLWGFCTPYCASVLSPASVAATKAGYAPFLGAATVNALFAGVPSIINTDADVNNLPVYTLGSAIFSGVGVGPTGTPAPYNRAANEPESQYRLYVQDVWKVKDSLTVNYGLAWNGQTGWYPQGLHFPDYLAPIFGAGNNQPTSNNMKEFQPAIGFAWTPTKSKKTVIRGGAGIFWDGTPGYYKNRSGASIGPPGDGRATVGSTLYTNIYPGIFNFSTLSTIPVGGPIPIGQLMNLSVAQFTNIVNTQSGTVAAKLQQANPQTSGPYTTTGIDLSKTGVEIYPPGGFPLPRSYQTSIGVQQDFGHNILLQADWARRQGENTSLGEVDMNHNNLYVNGAVSPVIPACTQAQLFVVGQECSTGAITVWTDQGRSVYEGLVMKVMKRMSNHYSLTASYAYQELRSDGGYFNTVNWMSGYAQSLAHQNLNISGVYNLPWGFSLSLNSSMISAAPGTVSIGNYPLPGVATSNQPLPGLPVGCENTGGCSKSQIASAVAAFNTTYAGTKAANGSVIPTLVLPSNYSLGQPLLSQDLRLTKTFKYKERYQMQIMAEMFNALNVANLSGFSNTLDANKCTTGAPGACAAQSFAFGQPTGRVAQTFGQGGPRAAQFGARISF